MMKRIVFLLLLCTVDSCQQNNPGDMYLVFENCDKLSTHIKVRSMNSEIGFIKNIYRDNSKVIAELKLEDNVKVPTGSKFSLKEDFLGGQLIEVIFSSEPSFYQRGDTILGKTLKEVLFDEKLNVDSVRRLNSTDSTLN